MSASYLFSEPVTTKIRRGMERAAPLHPIYRLGTVIDLQIFHICHVAPFGLKVGRATGRHANYEISHISPYTEFIYIIAVELIISSSHFTGQCQTCANNSSIFAIRLMNESENADGIISYYILQFSCITCDAHLILFFPCVIFICDIFLISLYILYYLDILESLSV